MRTKFVAAIQIVATMLNFITASVLKRFVVKNTSMELGTVLIVRTAERNLGARFALDMTIRMIRIVMVMVHALVHRMAPYAAAKQDILVSPVREVLITRAFQVFTAQRVKHVLASQI